MITPKKKNSSPREKKPEIPRKGADRSGNASKKAAKKIPSKEEAVVQDHIAGQGTPEQEADIDDVISQSVKSAYDALLETIGQGRKAAEQFRQGEYNFRQVPGDVEELARRMLHLARQLSGTTFDVCEQLLGQISDLAEPPEPGTTKVDSFRRHSPSGAPGGSSAAPPSSTASNAEPQMRVAVQFTGKKTASSPTVSIARPAQLTRPEELKASPLAPVQGKATPLKKVEFSADLSHGGVIAKITIPARQADGTYVGYIHAGQDETPLGMLVVKLGS